MPMLGRDLERAKRACAVGAAEKSRQAHENPPEQHQTELGRYIKSTACDGLAGTMATFAVVAGVPVPLSPQERPGCRVGLGVSAQAPHRPVRAQLTHTVPQDTAWTAR
jgi:hypothetical protein